MHALALALTLLVQNAAQNSKPKLLDVGVAAPEFETIDLDGKAVKLSDLKGKTVLLDFWFDS